PIELQPAHRGAENGADSSHPRQRERAMSESYLKEPGAEVESMLQRVDDTCDAFESSWRSGLEPEIEIYLGTTTGVERSKLLEELLWLELDYRNQRGEITQQELYLHRFPLDEEVIRAVFSNAGFLGDPVALGERDGRQHPGAHTGPNSRPTN